MMHGPTHIKIKRSDFPVLEHKLLFMYWTYYWVGVWMKMILETVSLSTSSVTEECCLSYRDVMHFTRSLMDFDTTGQQIIWNVGLLLPHYVVSFSSWSSYSQRITAYSLLIIYNHHKAICFFVVHKLATQPFQNTVNHKLQDSVRLQLTEYTTVIRVAVPRYCIWASHS